MVNEHTKRAQKIVKLRKEGYKFQQIADLYKISRQRVHQIYKSATK